MTIGSDTFIHHLLQQLGFDNIFSEQKRYPVIEMQDLDKAEIIMLSSEPYLFRKSIWKNSEPYIRIKRL